MRALYQKGVCADNAIFEFAFHVGATYELTFVSWLEGFKFSVVGDNLFDESYCDYATYGSQYYPAAGRCFTFTVRYEF